MNNTLPTSRLLTLKQDEIYRLTLFYSGLLLPYSIPGHSLLCFNRFDPRYISHAMSCSATRKNNVRARHELEYVVKSMHLLALEAHAYVKHEPRLGLEHTNRYTDLLLMFHTGEPRSWHPWYIPTYILTYIHWQYIHTYIMMHDRSGKHSYIPHIHTY